MGEACDISEKDDVFSSDNVVVPKSITVKGNDFNKMVTDLAIAKSVNGLKFENGKLSFPITCENSTEILHDIDLSSIDGTHFHDYNVNKVLVVNYINMYIDRMMLCEGRDKGERDGIDDKFKANMVKLGKDGSGDAALEKRVVEKIVSLIHTLLLGENSKLMRKISPDQKIEIKNMNHILDDEHNVHCLTLVIYANYILSRLLLMAHKQENDYTFSYANEGNKIQNIVFGNIDNVLDIHKEKIKGMNEGSELHISHETKIANFNKKNLTSKTK